MIVATSGHIDHGKTTLIRALTGVDTDRLPEEKARGMSIDIGFAHCTIDGHVIGFVDVPGHERFVRNMLSGVYGVDHVLLIVAADDGVMPQTREHFDIVNLLGLTQGTIVITKKDRVDADLLAQAEEEARDLVRGTALQDAPLIAVSSVTGEGIPALRDRLAAVAAATDAAKMASDALARYVVDRVFTVAGSGTIVTGTVISGAIRTGDLLLVSPSGEKARVRKLQRHSASVELAQAGERCAINLANVERADVTRGDWLVAPEAHNPTERIDVRVRLLASQASLKHWRPVHVHIGAADIPARVALRRGESIAPGTEAFAQLRLQRPISAVHGDRLILRDQSGRHTLGGGVVIDPFPPARRRAQRPALLAALDGNDARKSLVALLGSGIEGFELEWLARVFNVPVHNLLKMVPADALVVQTSSHFVLSGKRALELQNLAVARVKRFHAESKNVAGIELARLHTEIARQIPEDLFVALIKLFASRAGLLLQGTQLRLASHAPVESQQDTAAWQRIRPLLEAAGAAIPSMQDMSGQLGMPLPALRDVLYRKSKAGGELLRITEQRFALRETVAMLKSKAEETAKSQPQGLFTAAQYRNTIGTGRSLAIEILEFLDKRGETRRKGDLRSMRS